MLLHQARVRVAAGLDPAADGFRRAACAHVVSTSRSSYASGSEPGHSDKSHRLLGPKGHGKPQQLRGPRLRESLGLLGQAAAATRAGAIPTKAIGCRA